MEQTVSKVDYSKSLIYKLCCNNTDITDIYIGSTTNMKARKSKHKFSCNTPTDRSYNSSKYKFIRDNGGFSNWSIILIDYVDVNNKCELEKKEREYIENLKPSLNNNIPSRTPQEALIYHQEYQKKYQKEYQKEWRENNKQRIYEQIKCECGCMISRLHISRHRKTKKHIELMESK